MPVLDATEFRDLAAVVYEQTGIHLPDAKRTLLCNRLRKRLRALKLQDFGSYHALLRDATRCVDELPHFRAAVTTNETSFFRNATIWKHFREVWTPEAFPPLHGAASRDVVRIWSGACSSGEEAYTAAICLWEHLGRDAPARVQITASDLSEPMLERARAAEYGEHAIARVPAGLRASYFDEQEGRYVLKESVRRMVRFVAHDLRDRWREGEFDLILLCNVLMYLDLAVKRRVLIRVTDALKPGGYLVVGDVDPIRCHAELRNATPMIPGVRHWYRKPQSHMDICRVGGEV